MGRIRSLLKRIIKPEPPPSRPRTPPVFVPDPAAEGLETRPEELLKRIAEGEAVVFVDVRAGNEREVFIPDSIHMRVGEVSSRYDELDETKTVIFYCASGGQSINGAEVMRERTGNMSATSILGGLPAWEDAGGAVARED
jgi:rhodanese-related sulfurtransferase